MHTNTIVFITGAFLSNSIWDEWRIYFEAKGFITIAPSWPHKDATTDELKRRHPDAAIAVVSLQQLVAHYAGILKKLPEKTILIGHSAGGLVTQLLLQENLAMAGIAIHSFAPHDVMKHSFFLWKYRYWLWNSFYSDKKSFMMSFPRWQISIANNLPIAAQKSGYDQFLVPESKRFLRSALSGAAKVDFQQTHPPLLFIAGTADHLTPASLNYSNYKKYIQGNSITDFKEFQGKCHFVLGQPAWQEVAAFIEQWIRRL